jgi:polar amino acid transport system substrate-binding protein
MKMKKIFALGLSAALALSLAACGGQTPATEETEEASTEGVEAVSTISDGVLAVGMEIGYPPFESYASDGVTPVGLDIDIATAIAEKLGMEVKFVNNAFDTIFEPIGSNYDCVISAVTINDERKEQVDFSIPYIQNYQTLVVRKDSDLEVGGYEDLDSLTVGVQMGTTAYESMNELINTGSVDATLVPLEQVITCFSQLENGEIDAVLCDSSVAYTYLEKSDAFKIAWEQTENPEEFGVAVAKGDTALLDAINKALEELEEEGTLDEFLKNWIE